MYVDEFNARSGLRSGQVDRALNADERTEATLAQLFKVDAGDGTFRAPTAEEAQRLDLPDDPHLAALLRLRALLGDDLEEQISTKLTEQVGTEPKDVTCEDPLPAEEGEEVTCTLTAPDDTEYGVTVTTSSVDGDNVEFDIQVDDEPSS